MKLKAYSVYDLKALIYSPPFYAHNSAVAIRNVRDSMAGGGTSLSAHPADYVLYCVGEFDDQNGALLMLDPREHVVDLIALVPMTEPDLF